MQKCRNANECPLNNMCLTKDLIYQAEVITKEDNDIKTYIGMTAKTFKDRYRNHKKSFEDIKHENDTELSKHVSETFEFIIKVPMSENETLHI